MASSTSAQSATNLAPVEVSTDNFPAPPFHSVAYDLLIAQPAIRLDDLKIDHSWVDFELAYPTRLPDIPSRVVTIVFGRVTFAAMLQSLWIEAISMWRTIMRLCLPLSLDDPVLLACIYVKASLLKSLATLNEYCKGVLEKIPHELESSNGNHVPPPPYEKALADRLVAEWIQSAQWLQHLSDELKKKPREWIAKISSKLEADITVFMEWPNVLANWAKRNKKDLMAVFALGGGTVFRKEQQWDRLIGEPVAGKRHPEDMPEGWDKDNLAKYATEDEVKRG